MRCGTLDGTIETKTEASFALTGRSRNAQCRGRLARACTGDAAWGPGHPIRVSILRREWRRAPGEGRAYVAAFDPERQRPDEIAIVDVDPGSSSYSQIVGRVAMPNAGDELHH